MGSQADEASPSLVTESKGELVVSVSRCNERLKVEVQGNTKKLAKFRVSSAG